MKNLIIINGVRGAIGSACLARFSRDPKNTIYGLSRRALSYRKFLSNGKMADATLICSAGKINSFINKVNFSQYDEVCYIHALGLYPFEIDKRGKIQIKGDNDRDGINDTVMNLSHDMFISMINSIVSHTQKSLVHAVTFGSIADQHKPPIHQSWWKTIEKVKSSVGKIHNSRLSTTLLNISSVICPHELITRPFVFRDTDAKPRFWLTPDEVAQEVAQITSTHLTGFHEYDFFHPAEYYRPDYYSPHPFLVRKKSELGI